MSNVCFCFGKEAVQGWVPCLMCVSILESKYCKVGSHVEDDLCMSLEP
jgi:hypothetical protein